MAIRSGRFGLTAETSPKPKTIIVAAKKAGGAFYRVLNSGSHKFTIQDNSNKEIGVVEKENSFDFYVPSGMSIQILAESDKTAEGIYEFLGDGTSVSRPPESVRSGRFRSGGADIIIANFEHAPATKFSVLYRFLNSGATDQQQGKFKITGVSGVSVDTKESLDVAFAKGKVIIEKAVGIAKFEGIYDFLSGEDKT